MQSQDFIKSCERAIEGSVIHPMMSFGAPAATAAS
jgi:hypothetical protein